MSVDRVLCSFFLIAFTAGSCAISREEEGREQKETDARVSDTTFGSASEHMGNPESDGGADANGETKDDESSANSTTSICGNAIVEGEEACDDGNLYQRDGCTTLCELSCDDDQECDDLNLCNGVERCTEKGACDDSDPDLVEGAACGDRARSGRRWWRCGPATGARRRAW